MGHAYILCQQEMFPIVGHSQKTFQNKFLSISLEWELTLHGVKIAFLWYKISLEQPEGENRGVLLSWVLLKHWDVSTEQQRAHDY